MSKLNNKGQTLIMFVILLPLVLVIMALVVDISYLYKEKNKLENVTENILKDSFIEDENISNKIIDLYKKNNIPTENIKINYNEEAIIIKNKYDIDSIFGKIIGIKKYSIKLSMQAIKNENKVRIIKG